MFLLKFPISSLSGRYRENLFWRHAAASASVRPEDSSTLTPHFVSSIPPVMRGWNRYPGNFLNCIHSGPVGDRSIPACFAICILILVLYHRLHYRGLQWEMRYKYGEKLLRRRTFQDIVDISWNIFRMDIMISKLTEMMNKPRLWRFKKVLKYSGI